MVFTLEPMQKVRVICVRADLPKVIDSLYDFGAIDVRESKLGELDAPLEGFQEISEMLVRLRAVESTLGIKATGGKASHTLDSVTISELQTEFSALHLENLDELLEQLSAASSELSSLKSEREKLLPFRNLQVNPSNMSGKSVSLSYFKLKSTFAEFGKAMEKVQNESLLVRDRKGEYVFVAFDSRQAGKVGEIIAKHATATFEVPMLDLDFGAALSELDAKISVSEKRLASLEADRDAFKEKHAAAIGALLRKGELAAAKAQLPFKFGKTRELSVAEGWLEKKNVHNFKQKMDAFKLLIEEVATREMPPSKLKNPAFARPFEFLVEFFSLPKANELDPTLLVFLTFPIFFGMILGDMGYGLFTLALALVIRVKSKAASLPRRMSGMMMLTSFTTIIFGFIYAEFLGKEEFLGYHFHPYFHRLHEAEALIGLSILIGVIHVSLGFLLGAYVQAREGHSKHAIGKFAWFTLLISMIALVLHFAEISLLEFLKPLQYLIPYPFSAIIFAGSILAIAKFESPTHLVELPGLISNVLSYLRLAALGISAAVLALIISSLPLDFDKVASMFTGAAPFDVGALVTFILLFVIFIVGHIGAVLLGVFEASIQSLRLHYVEFFSKFYEGGGVAFAPLRKEGE